MILTRSLRGINEALLTIPRKCEQLMYDNVVGAVCAEVEHRADDLQRELDQVYAALATAGSKPAS